MRTDQSRMVAESLASTHHPDVFRRRGVSGRITIDLTDVRGKMPAGWPSVEECERLADVAHAAIAATLAHDAIAGASIARTDWQPDSPAYAATPTWDGPPPDVKPWKARLAAVECLLLDVDGGDPVRSDLPGYAFEAHREALAMVRAMLDEA